MTRDEALQRIAQARAACVAMLGEGILDAEVNTSIAILDAMTTAVNASWPLSEAGLGAVVIGRYAARNLEEPEYGKLSELLSNLDWDLKH